MGIDMNDYMKFFCPNPDNYFDRVMEIKTISFLFDLIIGGIKFFM